MLDPTMLNIDFLVEQLLKTDKPALLLSRLSPEIGPVFSAARPSQYVYYEGEPIPLPIISSKERQGLREEMDRALARLTDWEENRFVAAASSTLSDFIPTSAPPSVYTPSIPTSAPHYTPSIPASVSSDHVTPYEEPLNNVPQVVPQSVPNVASQIMPHEHVVPQIALRVNSAPFADALAAAVPRSVLDGPPYVPHNVPNVVPQHVPHADVPNVVPQHVPHNVPNVVPQHVPHADVPPLPLSKLLLKEEAGRGIVEVTREDGVEDKRRQSVVTVEQDAMPYAGFLCSPRTQCDDLITDPAEAAVRKLPQAVYSSSPMISKSYRPSSGPSQIEQDVVLESVSTVQNSTSTVLNSTSTVQNSTSTVETASTLVPAAQSSHEDSEWTFSGENSAESADNSQLHSSESSRSDLVDEPTPSAIETSDPAPSSPPASHRTETSPPSSKVLRHLEALEAAIELDSTLNMSTASTSAKRRLNLDSPPPPPRIVDSPANRADLKRPQTLQLVGKVGKRKLPQPGAVSSEPRSHTTSERSHTASERSHTASERSHTISQNDDTDEDVSFASESSRKSISFYVPVEPPAGSVSVKSGSPFGKSPMRPRSATVKSPGRPGPVSRPRSATALTMPSTNPPAETRATSCRRIRHDSYTISSEDSDQKAALVITKVAVGFLCRALLKSNKVQQHIKTIRDTNDLLKGYNAMSPEDYSFYKTLQTTLTQTRDKIAVIFFATPRTAQLGYIANSRAARREKQIREISQRPDPKRGPNKKIRQKAWI